MPVGCNARLRALLTAYAGQPLPAASEPLSPRPTPRVSNPDEPASRSPASYLWAALLARIYACFLLVCPNCGHAMELTAFVTEPPRVAPARGPPDESLAFDQSPRHDPSVPEPAPEYEFDQRLTW